MKLFATALAMTFAVTVHGETGNSEWFFVDTTDRSDVVVHFNANGGVFMDKDGNEVTQFDQYFTYGEAQRLFTDELTPMKMDEDGNANQFLGWVRGSPTIESSAYLVDNLIDGRAMKTWDDDVSEVTLYAVWTATLTISYYNRSDNTLSPSSLADHLTWRDGSPDFPITGKSGEPVQIWPGTPNIYLLIDDDYKWVAGQIKFVGRYGVANPYYDSSMCALHNIEIRGGQEYSIDVEVGPSQEFALEGEVVLWHSCAVREELRNLINSQRGNLPEFDPSKVRISIGRVEFNPAGNDYIPAKTGGLTGLELYKFYWLPVGRYYLKDVTYDTDTSSGDPYWGAVLGPTSARLIESRLIQVRNDDNDLITEYTINFDVFGGANVARAVFDSREGECAKSEAWFPYNSSQYSDEGIRVVSEKALPKPERTGFRFMGWFTKESGGLEFKEGVTIAGDKVRWNLPFDYTFKVYAQWTDMTDKWVNELFPDLPVFEQDVNLVALAKTTAANGKLTVAQCYSCGVDPTDPNDDLKITDFEMKDGKPVITLNHTEDGSGNSFLPRVKTLGAKSLDASAQGTKSPGTAAQWDDMSDVADPEAAGYRFFKVEVEMP